MNKQEWKREWRRQRIERRELQSSRSDDAHDDFTKDLPWHDDPQGYEQGLSAIIKLIGIGILLVVAAIGFWGFGFVPKSVLIVASVVFGLFILFVVDCFNHGYLLSLFGFLEDIVESIGSWSGWPFIGILLLITVALVVWIIWGWAAILGIGITMVVIFIVLYSRPPWPF